MRFIHDLSGNSWTCGSVSRQAFNLRNVDDRADVVEWLPAVIPGNVRSDLLALGRIPPLFFSDDYRASLWVEDCDWWYRRPLDLTLGPDQRAFLVFEGIDYLSAVLLNGRELGRQAGMFSQQVYEVSDALRTDGASAISSQRSKAANYSSEIAVRLWGSGALPQYRLSLLEKAWAWLADRIDPSTLGTFPDRMATIKCQMTFGWDFAPPIRTMGIWDDVQVVVTGGVFIEDVWVKSRLLDPAARLAHLAIQVTLDSDQSRSVRAGVQVSPANFNGPDIGPVFFDLDLPTGRSMHSRPVICPTLNCGSHGTEAFPICTILACQSSALSAWIPPRPVSGYVTSHLMSGSLPSTVAASSFAESIGYRLTACPAACGVKTILSY